MKKGKCSIARDKDEMVVKVREEPLTNKPKPTQSKSSQRFPPPKKHRAELMVIEEGDEVPVEHVRFLHDFCRITTKIMQ